jgi:CRISPR-associated protein Cas6
MDVVDVAFSLRGGSIPVDHGWRLYQLLAERLDWLDADPAAGVHPIRGARAVAGRIPLGARARLMLRLPRARVEQAYALSGTRLELGDGIDIGDAHLRTLYAYSALYSQFVSVGTADELAFYRHIEAQLRQTGIECKMICGRARRAQTQDDEIAGFSLMLHELTPEDSLRMQASGLGDARKLGCGIFVPHKSATAVGA